MDRVRTMMTPLLACVALGGATAAAQGHDPSAAAARARAQQSSNESPEARARQVAERQAWLQRLIGRFHAASVDTSYQSGAPSSFQSDTQSSPVFSSSTAQKQGRAECVALGTENGVSCLLDLRTKQGVSSTTAFRVTLPPPDAHSLAQQTDGALHMGMVQVTTMAWASLQGDTAIFRAECRKEVSRNGRKFRSSRCGRQVRITARPDGTRVRVSIESGSLRSTLMDLNRARRPAADEAAGRRSGQ